MDDEKELKETPEPETEAPEAEEAAAEAPAELGYDFAALHADIASLTEGISDLRSMLSEMTLGASIGAEEATEDEEEDYPSFDLEDLSNLIGD